MEKSIDISNLSNNQPEANIISTIIDIKQDTKQQLTTLKHKEYHEMTTTIATTTTNDDDDVDAIKPTNKSPSNNHMNHYCISLINESLEERTTSKQHQKHTINNNKIHCNDNNKTHT